MISSTGSCWPAGVGASRLARRLTTLLPATTLAAALETARIHSVAGLTGGHTAFVTTRPFRAPHHTISDVGLIGGGQLLMPGEVSRAHHGVLWLDELPEFKRYVLEALCQPLEQGITPGQFPGYPRPRWMGHIGGAGPGGCSGAQAALAGSGPLTLSVRSIAERWRPIGRATTGHPCQ